MANRLNIYVSHSKKKWIMRKNYINHYWTLKLVKRIILFYHIVKNIMMWTQKQILINSDLLIAEVSIGGTGIGLELGRAECNDVKIICIKKKKS